MGKECLCARGQRKSEEGSRTILLCGRLGLYMALLLSLGVSKGHEHVGDTGGGERGRIKPAAWLGSPVSK